MALSQYLAECAARVAGALGEHVDASITLHEHGVTLRAGSSTDSARRCDQAEAMAGEGPCIDAMMRQVPQFVTSVAEETRWDAWRQQTIREGFVRALAVPAAVAPNAVVALNLYSRSAGTWADETVSAAETYAMLIAAAVRLHLEFADADDASSGLYGSLSDAAAVERALGAIMETNDCSELDARAILENAANERGLSERVIAESILRSLVIGGSGDIVDTGPR
jgi:hypothetical protein